MKIVLLMSSHAESQLALNELTDEQIEMIKGIAYLQGSHTIKKKSAISLLTKGFIKAGFRYSMYHALSSLLYKNIYFKKLKKIYDINYFKNKHVPIFYIKGKTTDSLNQWLLEIAPDVIISLYYDHMIKASTVKMARLLTVNVHPSLLPKYRSGNPNFWVILNEEQYTGVTLHLLTEKIDAGDIIAQRSIPVKKDSDLFTLDMECAKTGGSLLRELLIQLEENEIYQPTKQNDTEATYAGMASRAAMKNFYSKGKKLFSIKTHLFRN